MIALQSYAAFSQMLENAQPIQEAIRLVSEFIVEKSQDFHNAAQEYYENPSEAASYNFVKEGMEEKMSGWCEEYNLDEQSDTYRAIKGLALLMKISGDNCGWKHHEDDPKAWAWIYCTDKLFKTLLKDLPDMNDYIG